MKTHHWQTFESSTSLVHTLHHDWCREYLVWLWSLFKLHAVAISWNSTSTSTHPWVCRAPVRWLGGRGLRGRHHGGGSSSQHKLGLSYKANVNSKYISLYYSTHMERALDLVQFLPNTMGLSSAFCSSSLRTFSACSSLSTCHFKGT